MIELKNVFELGLVERVRVYSGIEERNVDDSERSGTKRKYNAERKTMPVRMYMNKTAIVLGILCFIAKRVPGSIAEAITMAVSITKIISLMRNNATAKATIAIAFTSEWVFIAKCISPLSIATIYPVRQLLAI